MWNADSTYAAFVSDGQLAVFEAATETIIDLELPTDVRAITRTDGLIGDS